MPVGSPEGPKQDRVAVTPGSQQSCREGLRWGWSSQEEPGSGAPGRHEFWAENKHLEEGVRGSLLHPLETLHQEVKEGSDLYFPLRTGLPPVCEAGRKRMTSLRTGGELGYCWSSLCPAVHCTNGRAQAGQWAGQAWSLQWEGDLAPCPLPLPGPLEVSGLEKASSGHWTDHIITRGLGPMATVLPQARLNFGPTKTRRLGRKGRVHKAFHILCATDPWKDREADWHLPDKTMELSLPVAQPQGKAETSLSVQTTHLPTQASAELGEISPHTALRIRRSTALTL